MNTALILITSLLLGLWNLDNSLGSITDISLIDSLSNGRSLEHAVYHNPQNDPYVLKNMQNAYNNLSTGNTLQTLTPLQLNEFKKKRKLKPTHYLIKFYPKNLDQQYKLSDLECISISSGPTNYVPLHEDEVKKVEELFSTNKPVFPEKVRYTVRYNEYDKTDTTTYDMAIMYVVWPVEKKIPRKIKYKKCYNVFLPDYEKHLNSLSLSREALSILKEEAAALARKNDELNIFY